MEHNFTDNGPWIDTTENGPQIMFFATSTTERDLENIEKIGDDVFDPHGTGSIEIQMYAPLSSLLDIALDGHALTNDAPNIDADSKPLFDSVRAELVKLIAKIDSLSFA